MITFKPVVYSHHKKKDGTFPVKIKVYFKGADRRLPTTLVCKTSDLTRSLKIKSPTILGKTDELINRMRSAVQDLSPFLLENWNVDDVVAHIRKKLTEESFHLDFFQWGEQYSLTKSESTRRAYTMALNAFERFLGRREIDINDITRTLLMEFMEFIDEEPKMRFCPSTGDFVRSTKEKIPKGASSRHLMKLQHMFNSAKERFNDEDEGRILIPKSPFNNIKKTFPTPVNGQRNLGVELIQRIILAETDDKEVRLALDAFIVSFGLMGANMADLYNGKSFKGDVWHYNRLKTTTRRADKAEMKVTIPVQISPFLERLKGRTSDWWLTSLHEFSKGKDTCTLRVNDHLKVWCEDNDIPVFTFYASRHSWATIARSIGIEKATIDDCLCHKGEFSMADIYAEKSWELMNEANDKVLSLFQWTKKVEKI